MFARTTSWSYKCIKCQHRIILREARRIESTNTNPWASQRWQSSAARLATDEENNEEIVDPEYRVPITYDTSVAPPNVRHWRPAPTAEIGTEVLGKPAEILLLPAKKRRRREKASDTDESNVHDASSQVLRSSNETAQPRIHEYLAQESKPTSIKDALGNIEKIREEAQNAANDGHLRKEEWTKYFVALSKGFTKKQIERYLTENSARSEATPVDNTVFSRSITRPRAAMEIMTNIWGLRTDKELPADPDALVTKTINLGRGRRELIMGVDREWRRFLKTGSIVSSAVPGHIDIAGPESWTRKVESVFASLKKTVQEKTITMPRVYARALDEQSTASDTAVRLMLLELIQKHQVTLTKDSRWKVYGYGEQRVGNFEREFLLSQREISAQLEESNTQPVLSLRNVNKALVTPVCKDLFAREPDLWYRYSESRLHEDGQIKNRTSGMSSQAVENLVTDLNHQMHSGEMDTLNYVFSDTHSTPTEISAAIGQVLHRSSGAQLNSPDEQDAHLSTSQTSFACTIPFLSQFLAEQEKISLGKDTTGVTDSLISLTFIPSDINVYPEIEIEASVPISAGAYADLNIKSVRFKFPSSVAHVVLPSTTIDLRFDRRTFVPIFQEGSIVQENFVPLLGQLGSQVREEQENHTLGVRSLELNTLLNLNLDCLRTTSGPKESSGRAQSTSTPVRYALDKAEMFEKQLYRLPGHEDFVLEHVAYSPFKTSSSQALEHSLRIIPNSAGTNTVPEKSCAKLTKSAPAPTPGLGGLGTHLTRELAQQQEEYVDAQGAEEPST